MKYTKEELNKFSKSQLLQIYQEIYQTDIIPKYKHKEALIHGILRWHETMERARSLKP